MDTDPTAEMAGWPLVGRDAVINALVEGAQRAAREGTPAAASVVGEPGQGKSHLFRVLVKRLGYTRFVAQGGDWGSPVSNEMAKLAPPELLGIHVNLPGVVPPEIVKALRSFEPLVGWLDTHVGQD